MCPFRLMRGFISILIMLPNLVHAKEILTLAYVEYPPLVFTKSVDTPGGELIDYINNQLHNDFLIKWKKLPIGRVQWALETGYIDATPFYVKTPERAKFADFFEKPYLLVQAILSANKNREKKLDPQKPLADQLEGAKVISVLHHGFRFPFLLSDKIEQIQIPFADYIGRSVDLILSNRADFVFFPLSSVIVNEKIANNVSCINAGNAIGMYFAFSKQNPLKSKVEKIFAPLDPLER